jgi:hypothetical protein
VAGDGLGHVAGLMSLTRIECLRWDGNGDRTGGSCFGGRRRDPSERRAPPIALGVRFDPLARQFRPPGKATIRRVLESVDATMLDVAVSSWLAVNGVRRRMGHSGTPLDSIRRVPGTLDALTWATRYARTRGGQIAGFTRREMKKWQVSGHSDGLGWAHCKTVGSAYVGSNPTPATTCGNSP